MGIFTPPFACLKSLDLFGVHPSIYFQGHRKSPTSFGCFLSVLLIIFTLTCLGYFGQDLFYRKNPNLRYHEEYNQRPQSITLNPEHLPIIIELNSMFGDMYFTNPNLLSINISQFSIRKFPNQTIVTSEDYPMEICKKEHFKKLEPETESYFLQKNINDYFCIPTYLKNLTMEGAFDQDVFQAVKITVSICNNLTTNNTCLPLEEIKNIMNRGFIGVFFGDYTIDAGNYLIPKRIQPKEIFTNFVLNSQKQIDILMRNNYIETEDGTIFESKHEERVVNFIDSHEFDFKLENPDFLLIFFKVKQEDAHYERNYGKLQNLIAQIGGFINCFWIIAFSFNYLYGNLFMISQILIKNFTIKISNPEIIIKESQIKSTLTEIKNGNKPITFDKENLEKDLEKDPNVQKMNQLKEELKNFEVLESLDLNLLDYLHFYTGWFESPERERKKLIIKKGETIVKTCLDIKFIIQKFYEIEKLKQMVLSEKDLEKFDKMPKPELMVVLKGNKKEKKRRIKGSIFRNVLGKIVKKEGKLKGSIMVDFKKVSEKTIFLN